jgi:transposase InsO family protein
LITLIRSIHAEYKGAYGSPRVIRELRDRGFPVSKGRVERVIQENGTRARHKRRNKATTDSRHGLPVAPNLLDWQFQPFAPNQVWTSDITYLSTTEGGLYLAIVLDLFNREVVGWSIQPSMTVDLVTDALRMAWFRRQPAPGLIHHSDRGSQNAAGVFQDLLREYGMKCSMSRKGNCWDNAPTESWFGRFKNERIHGESTENQQTMRGRVFEYIEVFYNRKRRHSTLGYQSPIQYLRRWAEKADRGNQAA